MNLYANKRDKDRDIEILYVKKNEKKNKLKFQII